MIEIQVYDGARTVEREESAVSVWKDRGLGLLLCLCIALPCWLLGKTAQVEGAAQGVLKQALEQANGLLGVV